MPTASRATGLIASAPTCGSFFGAVGRAPFGRASSTDHDNGLLTLFFAFVGLAAA
jgi:hypothetical protein